VEKSFLLLEKRERGKPITGEGAASEGEEFLLGSKSGAIQVGGEEKRANPARDTGKEDLQKRGKNWGGPCSAYRSTFDRRGKQGFKPQNA